MTFDTPRQVKLLVTKKKTEKLLTSVRKGGLFTVFGWRSLLKRVRTPTETIPVAQDAAERHTQLFATLMHSGLILCVCLVWLKRISIQRTLEETQVKESINNDHVKEDDIITCSICGDQEDKRYSWRYKCTVYCNVCAIEHCGKIIEKPRATVEEDNCDNYYSNKALCVTCGEVNYAEPVYEIEGRSRMVCCDCIEIVNRCQECNNLTLDYVYESPNYDGVRVANRDLCFNCKFKKPLREQMPLAVHLLVRRDIQTLSIKHFDILADYAELCEFTIFDAYRYKSRCHCYDCDRMVLPSAWDAEEAVQFCCRRHCDIAELNGCHYQNVYDGSDYDEDWEQATCKVCNNSNHDTNMIPRIALRESDQGVKPIVSAICVFNDGIKMSNILAESLVDLCEYFI